MRLLRLFSYATLVLHLYGWGSPYNPNTDHHLQRGLAYLEVQEIGRAKANLLKSWNQNPNTPETNSALAHFFETTQAFQIAGGYYIQAIRLSRGQAIYHNNYGNFLFHRAHYTEARVHFLKAIEDHNYLNIGLAYENLGLCSLQMQKLGEARSFFSQAVQADPNLKNAWLGLAVLDEPGQSRTLQYIENYQRLTSCSDEVLLKRLITFASHIKKEETARYYLNTCRRYKK